MLIDPRHLVGWTCIILSWSAWALASSTQPEKAAASLVVVASTCPSRTINHITHTLPQQCLRTDWSRSATAAEASGETTASGRVNGQSAAAETTTESVVITNNASASAIIPPAQRYSSTEGILQSSAIHDSIPSLPETDIPSAPEQEEDPLSDGVNFVSFEEWKSQMLKNAGQSPQDIGVSRKEGPGQEGHRRPAPIHQALDSLGDDAEIELDFSGFGSAEEVASAVPAASIPKGASHDELEGQSEVTPQPKRSREAGKTSRERFNYASFDCAATVLKTNSECKGANWILAENKDSYMLNSCSATNKFFIVELCNDILIDTIALGNYEFFSSTFRQFRVSISDRYPVKLDKWREIGLFEARNTRGIQAFLVENGLIWARYLRIEFLSHYGAEYYCPVSVLRVHGKTMMDDYRNDVKAARGEDDPEDEQEPEPEDGDNVVIFHADHPTRVETPAGSAPINTQDDRNAARAVGELPALATNSTASPQPSYPPNCRGPGSFNDKCPRTNYLSPLIEQTHLFKSACSSTAPFCNMELAQKIEVESRAPPATKSQPTPAQLPAFKDFDPPRIAATAATLPTAPPAPTSQMPVTKTSQLSATRKSGCESESQEQPSLSPSTSLNVSESPKPERPSSATSAAANFTSNNNSVSSSTTASSSKASAPSLPAPTPPTQESFFKSVHKRLQLLEANSTLSLQYIEEQSRLLREAFTKVEKRQLNKTSSFLSSLNDTVLSELRDFRTQYDQIWQSTILELSSQREQSTKEAAGLSARLAILADEVVWQKRLVYLQFGLIMLCLGLFAFSRGAAGSAGQSYIELPHLRHMLSLSPQASFRRGRFRSGTESSVRHGLDTPVSSPSRPASRHGITWAKPKMSDGDSDGGLKSADGTSDYQVPTPPSENEYSNALLKPEPTRTDSPIPEPILRRAISSPVLGLGAQSDIDNDDDDEPTENEKSDGNSDLGMAMVSPKTPMAAG